MECVCQIRSGIGRKISLLFARPIHLHVPECADDLFTGVFSTDFFLQYPEDKLSNVTGYEMCPDPILLLQVYRTSLEFCLNDPKIKM